jgi:hypothetical protein
MPTNTEKKGSELGEGVRLKGECLSMLEGISKSNTKDIQTIGIEDPQFQFQFPAFNVYIQFQFPAFNVYIQMEPNMIGADPWS